MTSNSGVAAVVGISATLSDELAEINRQFHNAEETVAAALARINRATDEHRGATAAWAHAMERRNALLRQRADLLARMAKQEAGQ